MAAVAIVLAAAAAAASIAPLGVEHGAQADAVRTLTVSEMFGLAEAAHSHGNDALAETCSNSVVSNALPNETLEPEGERCAGNGQRNRGELARALSPPLRPRPWEESEERSRAPRFVAVVQVVSVGVVEVHRPLHQAKPEDAGVEVDVPLHITRDHRDVMDA